MLSGHPGEGNSRWVIPADGDDSVVIKINNRRSVLKEARHAVETPADVVAWVCQRAGTLVLLTVVMERDWELLGRLCAGTEAIPVTVGEPVAYVLGPLE
ncbi:hypothetical protein [Actinomadura sp. 9N215]|uniref:hypothetical protein n=1 Tax=Actinomadura sp. 9N215 TaxID=3375150 RepID=UPI00379E0FE9